MTIFKTSVRFLLSLVSFVLDTVTQAFRISPCVTIRH